MPTLTFKTLYVLVFIAHDRRELVHVNVTANPTAAWVWRQLIEATPRQPCLGGWNPAWGTGKPSADEQDGSVSTLSPRPFGHLGRTQSPSL